jgi:hypothetical protein
VDGLAVSAGCWEGIGWFVVGGGVLPARRAEDFFLEVAEADFDPGVAKLLFD